MNFAEFCYMVQKELERVKGCLRIECCRCDYCIFWYEGGLQTLYDKKYKNGCPNCGGLLRMFGYDGEDAEL